MLCLSRQFKIVIQNLTISKAAAAEFQSESELNIQRKKCNKNHIGIGETTNLHIFFISFCLPSHSLYIHNS